jgi:cysteine desulfurase
MGAAYALADVEGAAECERLRGLLERLWGRLQALADVYRNGHGSRRAPHILNVSFDHVDGEALRYALSGLAVSSGSACGSSDGEPSYVLRALGRSDTLASASLRFSVGRTTTLAEIDQAAELVVAAVSRLRAIGPG